MNKVDISILKMYSGIKITFGGKTPIGGIEKQAWDFCTIFKVGSA